VRTGTPGAVPEPPGGTGSIPRSAGTSGDTAAFPGGRPFRPGERVLLVDAKARRYLVTLVEGATFSTHAGSLSHDALIGREEGILLRTTHGARLRAVRPTLSDYILKMPRGAQVVYPKDIGPILVLADVFPGARVLEAGVGSGALSMALLRAVGAGGTVLGYEIREDFAVRARRNVETFLGPGQPYTVEIRDVYEGIDSPEPLDRIVLDLPEPWQVVKHAEAALRPGGILFAYLPTIGQVSRLHDELAGSTFGMAETVEVLQRSWHVEGQSIRPDHRMVAHTGFLTAARLLDVWPGGAGVSPEMPGGAGVSPEMPAP
jgi:tRNA (adenine57-N1/adenine58-N1)-methyltransferase catalytic subunit